MKEEPTISVDRVMAEIEEEIRGELRKRLLRRGATSAFEDPALFADVERRLRRSIEESGVRGALLATLLGDARDWQLRTELRFASHRPVTGGLVVFLKRRVLLPLTRWLYEYCLENFTRQQRLNVLLIACVEDLATDNARLRQALQQLRDAGR